MQFEWEDAKARANLVKHGIDFDDVVAVFEGATVCRQSDRDTEPRWLCIGELHGRVVAVVYTWRGEYCRIISARMASRDERTAYHEALRRRAEERPNEVAGDRPAHG